MAEPNRLPRVGDTVGDYRIESALGAGAMGAVYLATEQATGRRIALKVAFLSGGTNRRERFEREGSITAGLEHPGIVTVHATNTIYESGDLFARVDYTKNELEIWSMATGELLVRTELPWAPASVSVAGRATRRRRRSPGPSRSPASQLEENALQSRGLRQGAEPWTSADTASAPRRCTAEPSPSR